jgi:glycosyltransferase involved in cell wall biosynthesis
MSRVKCGPYPFAWVNGVDPDSDNDFSRNLVEIAEEVESNMFDVFVFPTRFEGLGIVIIEAQVNELPIFTTDMVPKEAIICNDLITVLKLNETAAYLQIP